MKFLGLTLTEWFILGFIAGVTSDCGFAIGIYLHHLIR